MSEYKCTTCGYESDGESDFIASATFEDLKCNDCVESFQKTGVINTISEKEFMKKHNLKHSKRIARKIAKTSGGKDGD